MARTKKLVCKRVYVAADGTELGRSANNDAVALEFRFYNDGDESGKPTGDVLRCDFGDMPGWATVEGTARLAAMHGISQKVGDTFADSKDPTATPFDVASAKWETVTSGLWVEEGTSAGPRISQLLEAFVRSLHAIGKLPAAKPDELDAETLAAVRAHITDDDAAKAKEKREKVAAIPEVKAALDAVRAEAAAKRAKESAKAAKASDGGGLAGITV